MARVEGRDGRPGRVDWVVGALVLVMAAAIGSTPSTVSASFEELFRSLGEIEELPLVTRVALSRWYGPAWAVGIVAVAVVALLTRRRVLLGLGLGLGLFGVGVYLFGVYLPLFELVEVLGP